MRWLFSLLFSKQLSEITTLLNKIYMKIDELRQVLNNVREQLAKASTEILTEIQRLKDLLENVELPEDVQQSLADLSEKAQTLDDIVPDQEPEPEPEEPSA